LTRNTGDIKPKKVNVYIPIRPPSENKTRGKTIKHPNQDKLKSEEQKNNLMRNQGKAMKKKKI